MSDKNQTPTNSAKDAEVIANLDLLMSMDVLENEKDWDLFSSGGSSTDSMPLDGPDAEPENTQGDRQ